MKRVRSTSLVSVNVEQPGFAFTFTSLVDDMLAKIIGYLDYKSMVLLSMTSRALRAFVWKRFDRFRYFISGYYVHLQHYVHLQPARVNTLAHWSLKKRFPTESHLIKGVVKAENLRPEQRDLVAILSCMEIDQTCEGSRKWWVNDPDTPPLLPLEIARKEARKRKDAEFAAALARAVENGLLCHLTK
jgi:hypothetical protein